MRRHLRGLDHVVILVRDLDRAREAVRIWKAALPPGQRDLVLTAERDGRELFRSKNRIDVE